MMDRFTANRDGGPILLVGPLPPPHHGVAAATQALCSQFDARGIEYVLVDTADRRGLDNIGHMDWHNVELALRHGTTFLRLLWRKRPSVVYVPISQNTLGFLRDLLFLGSARIARRSLVVHLHGSYFRRFYNEAPFWMRWIIRWSLGGASRVIVLGDNLRGIFSGIVPADRVVVVPNGIDDSAFHTARRLTKPSHHDEIRVVYLGSLMKAKGFIDVLAAVPLARKHCPHMCFTLAGEAVFSEEMDEAAMLIGKSGSADCIDLPGIVTGDDKVRLLMSSDIFVFPPRQAEGQPLVILEAMAAGLPVVTTDKGAIRETVIDGVTGFLVPEGDPHGIAERVVLLAKDPALRRRMAEASRSRFLERYRVDRWGEDMVRLFLEVGPARTGLVHKTTEPQPG